MLKIARLLMAGGACGTPGHPTDTELRRAVSSVYYAMFHAICRCCAGAMVGTNLATPLAQQMWEQAYRAPDHKQVKGRCNNATEMGKFAVEIKEFGELFVDLQRQRHEADYDPAATFSSSGVLQSITEAENAIRRFQNASPSNLRQFAVYILTKIRQPP